MGLEVADVPERGDVYLVFLVAPMTTGGHPYPFRIPCQFREKTGCVVLDQLCTVDQVRMVRRLGRLSSSTMGEALDVLQRMFAP